MSRASLSVAEREVLKMLWEHGPGTIRELNELPTARGRKWAYTTLATLLRRLQTKGYVEGDVQSVPHVFRAAVSRDELLDDRLRAAADELCDGEPAPLMLALMQSSRFTPSELTRLRKLLDDAKSTSKSKPKPK